MDLLENLIDDNGFGTTYGFTDQTIMMLNNKAKEMDLSVPEHRKQLIEMLGEELSHFYLKHWDRFISTDNMSEDLVKKVEVFIQSVEIYYITDKHKFGFEFDTDYFAENYHYDCEISDEVLSLLSPGWEIRSMFMLKDQKEVLAEEIVVDTVKDIVEKTVFLNELYNKFPELIRDQVSI